MKILVHDYAGHPFQVQLSRHLARRGHEVLHVFSTFFQTPRGSLARQPDDPPGFAVRGLDIGAPFEKYNFFKRVFQERAYGRRLAETIAGFRPDVVLSANTPLDAQAAALKAARVAGAGFVFWIQDLYSVAIYRILRQRLPVIGGPIGRRYMALEKRLVRRSDHVVAITDDFAPILGEWGVAAGRLTVIENWAPLDELPARPRDNAWAAEHGLAGKLVFMYSGTLGLKHNPDLMLQLAHRYQSRPEVRIVVISEGLGADWLRERAQGLENFQLLPFQPFARMPEVIASGDILMAVLEPEAGVFSVPSKVLTYFCAGRPLLTAIPAENLAARIIGRIRAGLVAPPGDGPAFLAAADRLVNDAALRAELGKNALDYARKTFDIDAIGTRFEGILARVAKG
ncbi:MAG: glycosyltransferase family 4 protein [Rhodospirillales bacterium]|nr:glycosyltransferase family 4 protein [Rhodospirillales bacterium]